MSRFYLRELITLIGGKRIVNYPNKRVDITGNIELKYDVADASLCLTTSSKIDAVPFFPSLTEPTNAIKYGLVAGILINSNNRYLVINRSSNSSTYSNRLAIPAGYVEKDELPIDACRRETMEEVGIDLSESKIDLACVVDSVPKDTMHNILLVYQTRLDREIKPRVDIEEVSHAEYMTTGQIMDNIDRFPPGIAAYFRTLKS